MREKKSQHLKALSYTLRRLGKEGSWEAAAKLAVLALGDDIDLDAWPDSVRLELAEVLIDIGIHSRRMNRPIAGNSAGQWCDLAIRLAGQLSPHGPDFAAIRNHVHYWHAVTRLEDTAELAVAEEATATLHQLLAAFPVEGSETATIRALHLSRIARAQERCAELDGDLARSRGRIRHALNLHDEAEAIIRSIGWTESVEYAALLQRRAITMRTALWVDRAAGAGGSAAEARAVVDVIQRSLDLFRRLDQVHVRDVTQVLRRLSLSMMDTGDYDAALDRAREAISTNQPSVGANNGAGAVSVEVVAIAVAAAVAAWGGDDRHMHYTRLRELLDTCGHIHRVVGSVRELSMLEFDMALARMLCDRYPSRVFDPRGYVQKLQCMIDIISLHGGPSAADTLCRRNLIAVLVTMQTRSPTGGGR